jgi:hypothetical protein
MFTLSGKSFNVKSRYLLWGMFLAVPKGCLPAQKTAYRIKQWLESEGLDCVALIGEFAKNTLFSYHITLASGTEITVFQPTNKSDSITISATLFLSEDKVKSLRKKQRSIQEGTFSEVLIKLAPLDVEVSLEGGQVFQRININHQIYFDGLTKDRFFTAISTVNRAYRLAEWIVEQTI